MYKIGILCVILSFIYCTKLKNTARAKLSMSTVGLHHNFQIRCFCRWCTRVEISGPSILPARNARCNYIYNVAKINKYAKHGTLDFFFFFGQCFIPKYASVRYNASLSLARCTATRFRKRYLSEMYHNHVCVAVCIIHFVFETEGINE